LLLDVGLDELAGNLITDGTGDVLEFGELGAWW
jgi:hypothetical protein